MRNRVRQSRTLGSVRGEGGAATVTLHGHAAGNGGYGQGEPTAAACPLLLGGAFACYQHTGVPLTSPNIRRFPFKSSYLFIDFKSVYLRA